MGIKLFLGALVLAAFATGDVCASDECQRKVSAAYLFSNLTDLSVTTGALNLLNGREDAKLRRLLEWRLLTVAADARRHIDQGVNVEASPAIPNLRAGVERASAYVKDHNLDSVPPMVPGEDPGKASANLEVVKKWLATQP